MVRILRGAKPGERKKFMSDTLQLKTGASFNRATSKQNYETPPDFVQAVEKRFGKLEFDLACDANNKKADEYFTEFDDSLSIDWWSATKGKLCWLNPPFSNIAPWAKKCDRSSLGCRILFLVPASVGSNWFGEFVINKSLVMALNPRLKFVGARDPYPKDCVLCYYGYDSGFEQWRWK